MIITKVIRQLSVVLFAGLLSCLLLNCHTTKNPESGDKDKNTKDQQDVSDKVEDKNDKGADLDNVSTDSYELGDVLPLTKGGYIKVADLKLKVSSVADSRCPKGVNCITAGKAKIELMVIKQGDMASSASLTARGNCDKTDGSCGNSANSQGYTFTLMSLTPYPGDDGKTTVQQDKYVANVRVDKE